MNVFLLAIALLLPSQSRRAPSIELTAPSYGHVIYYAPDGKKPKRIKGYKWFRSDVGFGAPWPSVYKWALYRMRWAPPNDDEVLSNLPKDPRSSVWSGPPLADTEMPLSVYTIRGGPKPNDIPLHAWTREEIWPELCWDGHPHWSWQLYRRHGAPPLRKTDECPHGTWVPKELDTPFHRAMRRNVGLTNYEIYEVQRLNLASRLSDTKK